MTQIRLGLRRGEIPPIGSILRLVGGSLPPLRAPRQIGLEGLLEQRLRASLFACINRRNRSFFSASTCGSSPGTDFDLLEQRQVPRRNLAQLGIQILDCDFALAQDPKNVVTAMSVTPNCWRVVQSFEQFGRNGPAGQHIVNNLLELCRRDPAVQPPVKLIVTFPCVRSMTGLHGASVRTPCALADAKATTQSRNQCARNEYPPHVSDSGSEPQPRMIQIPSNRQPRSRPIRVRTPRATREPS